MYRVNAVGNATNSSGSFVAMSSGNGTLAYSNIDAQGLPLNLGSSGTVIHNVLIEPGTITAGTQSNNGSF
jgi:hypothetical protein